MNNCAATLSSVPEDKEKYWKEGILMTLMTSEVIRRQLWKPFQKNSSKIVLKVDHALALVRSFPRGILWRRQQWNSALRCDEFANFIVKPRISHFKFSWSNKYYWNSLLHVFVVLALLPDIYKQVIIKSNAVRIKIKHKRHSPFFIFHAVYWALH
jgi:hypothetical protein